MEARVKGIRLITDFDGNTELCLMLSEPNLPKLKNYLTDAKQKLINGKIYDCLITEHREKRSLNANAYLWVLLEKMAQKLHTSKDELYDKMLIDYGVFETITVAKEAAEEFKRLWNGPVKELGTGTVNGKEFTHLRVCFGSSNYDKKQMTRLLEGVVNECTELGIETKTPEEMAQMFSLMEEKNV